MNDPTAATAHRAPSTPTHGRRNAIVAATGLIAIAITAYVQHARSKDPGPWLRYELASVGRGPIQAKVTATGTVNPIVTGRRR